MRKKVCYLLSGNLSTTPRALQSIRTAQAFFEVSVLSVNRSPVWKEIDEQLAREFQIDLRWISLTKKPFALWLLSSIVNKVCIFLYPLFNSSLVLAAFASSKASILLYWCSRKLKVDFVVSHSSGSIYPAYIVAKRMAIGFAVDVEDYHPGEAISMDAENEKKRRIKILQQVLPRAQYVTYASPLIGEHTLKLLSHPLANAFLINNCFSAKDFKSGIAVEDAKLKLVWFSQNISYKRGLELLLPAVFERRTEVSLCLIGKPDSAFYEEWIKANLDCLEVVAPLPQKDLHQALAGFDVGFATEVASADLNRSYALTNKIFAYSQAGLYIVATDTPAQTGFMGDNKILGTLCRQNEQSFSDALFDVLSRISEIRLGRAARYEYAQGLSWEVESLKLIEAWKQISLIS